MEGDYARRQQSGLHPSNCRLLGHDEALMSGSGDGSHAILVLGFESGDHPLDPWIARALEICSEHRGEPSEAEGDAAAVWRAAFLRGPHLRDGFARLGLLHETFETGAVTWDRFWDLHRAVLDAVSSALARGVRGRGGLVPVRVHVYPDGLRALLLGLRSRARRGRARSSGTRSSLRARRRRDCCQWGHKSHITMPSDP